MIEIAVPQPRTTTPPRSAILFLESEMNKNKEDNASELDPFWLTGKDLERHFSLEDALLEFSQVFNHQEKNDRGLVIGGVAYLEMQLEHMLINVLVDDPKEIATVAIGLRDTMSIYKPGVIEVVRGGPFLSWRQSNNTSIITRQRGRRFNYPPV